jgi:hypothetical protein
MPVIVKRSSPVEEIADITNILEIVQPLFAVKV